MNRAKGRHPSRYQQHDPAPEKEKCGIEQVRKHNIHIHDCTSHRATNSTDIVAFQVCFSSQVFVSIHNLAHREQSSERRQMRIRECRLNL
jgi:hypothetical protein